MLILKRKVDEAIKINKNISIKILEISENQVKIGIDAPKEIEILRSELLEDVKLKMKEASTAVKDLPDTLKKINLKQIKVKRKNG
ncbi:MAG: carbon storage regulator [Ignavibacteria bacterium]|nr:MAG: carbon storage regulator [Ignavibacteria bacterium]